MIRTYTTTKRRIEIELDQDSLVQILKGETHITDEDTLRALKNPTAKITAFYRVGGGGDFSNMDCNLTKDTPVRVVIEYEERVVPVETQVHVPRGCDCIASGNKDKPKQHSADPHAKNCAIYDRVGL